MPMSLDRWFLALRDYPLRDREKQVRSNTARGQEGKKRTKEKKKQHNFGIVCYWTFITTNPDPPHLFNLPYVTSVSFRSPIMPQKRIIFLFSSA